MEGGRETEAHPGCLDAAADAVRPQGDVDPERLKHVRTATPARRGPVAVLGHGDAGARGHQRCRRGDIEGPGAIATGAAGIDRVVGQLQGRGVRSHRVDEPGHLFDGLPLGPKRDQHAGDLDGRRLAGHHLVHHVAGLLASERGPGEQLLDRLRRRHGRGY